MGECVFEACESHINVTRALYSTRWNVLPPFGQMWEGKKKFRTWNVALMSCFADGPVSTSPASDRTVQCRAGAAGLCVALLKPKKGKKKKKTFRIKFAIVEMLLLVRATSLPGLNVRSERGWYFKLYWQHMNSTTFHVWRHGSKTHICWSFSAGDVTDFHLRLFSHNHMETNPGVWCICEHPCRGSFHAHHPKAIFAKGRRSQRQIQGVLVKVSFPPQEQFSHLCWEFPNGNELFHC